jgi:hypothetical protein
VRAILLVRASEGHPPATIQLSQRVGAETSEKREAVRHTHTQRLRETRHKEKEQRARGAELDGCGALVLESTSCCDHVMLKHSRHERGLEAPRKHLCSGQQVTRVLVMCYSRLKQEHSDWHWQHTLPYMYTDFVSEIK